MATAIWLNGNKVDGKGHVEAVRSPFDGAVVGEVGQAGAAQVDEAIAGMVRAWEGLSRVAAWKRGEICALVSRRIAERAEEFARLMALEAGKPLRTGRGEVARAVTTFKLAAEEATRSGPGSGERLPLDVDSRGEGYWGMVERFAIGPCSLVTPFNFPLNLVAHKVAPAIACGCPFVVKPSERTPLTALVLGEILAEAYGAVLGDEWAKGRIGESARWGWSILPCDREVAKPLVTDERIKLLSFTGSPEVGFAMKAAAGKKQVVLELGNNSAVIVEPDVGDGMAEAVKRIVAGAFGYAGQSCISVQRVLVHEAIAAEMTPAIVKGAEKLIVGDPMDEKSDVGPVIDEAAAERILRWVKESGGEVLCGGTRGGPKGTLVMPTVVRGANPTSELVCKEAFGPVAVVETYRDFEEALARVNGGRYGLQAGVFSRDIQKVRRAFETLEVGGLIVNDVPTTRMDNMPYGAVKDSGLGREGVKYAMEHMTERRVMVVRG